MKSVEQLKDFYKNELSSDLQQFEKERKQIEKKVIRVCGVIFAIAVFGFISLCLKKNINPLFLVVYLSCCMILGGFTFGIITRNFTKRFEEQQNIVRDIVIKFICPNLNYQHDQFVEKRKFQQSNIFSQRIDRYRGEDLVEGHINKIEIEFSEIHAQEERSDEETVTIFKGLFFIAKFNKHFHGQTLVLPDTAESIFGGFGKMLQSWNMSRPDLVKLEDPEFEREFVVYGNDQIEARYILSTSLMRRILDFKNKTGTKIYISFTGSKVYVAVPIKKNMFEPKYFSSVSDFEPILDYYRDLEFSVGIVDDLNLNTRIWTKE